MFSQASKWSFNFGGQHALQYTNQTNRAQFCLLKWWPGRPNFVFGNQNLNLVANVFELSISNWPTEEDIEKKKLYILEIDK
jgi:hypothetical protein